jgi:PAS domain S-box-containing protein
MSNALPSLAVESERVPRVGDSNSEHIVQFYQDDSFLIDVVSGFVGSALAAGNAAIMIATVLHRKGVERLLKNRGLEISKATRQRRFIALDASETLSKFTVNGQSDNELFRTTIEPVLMETASSVTGEGRRVVAFGEMVNVLWATGNYEGALRLEQLWNRLAEQHSFSLLCAYPISGFNSAKHTESFLRICAEHSAAFSSESFPEASRENERLRSVAQLQQQAVTLQNESALLHSEQRFRLFVEAVRDYAIFMLDTNGNITTWNTGAERIKGYKPSEIIGRHFSIFYPDADLKSRKPWRELEVAAEKGRFEDEGWRLRKDGSKFWANVIITAIRDEEGRLCGFGKVTRDLTEKRIALDEMQDAHKHLQAEVVERQKAEQRLHRSEESLRRLSLHLLRSQDEERRRIGRDLHDSLGQSLAILKINLDSLDTLLPASQEQVREKLAQCLHLSEEAIREVRTISYLLYPPMLEELGLSSAIPWYLDGFTKRSHIATALEISPGFGRLALPVELALFRVLQESLTNVHRHSGSATARVRLFEEQDSVVLEIEDQGKGLPPAMLELHNEDLPAAFGVGLRGMSERLGELGGRLEIKAARRGAIVRAVVPSPRQEEVKVFARANENPAA